MSDLTSYTYIIAAFFTGILGPVILAYVKNHIAKKKEKPADILLDSLRIGGLISGVIDDIKEELDCDRVWIAQFHNGGNFYPTGKSIAKFSILYECVNVGTMSIQGMFQNIPVNLFSKAINRLHTDDLIEINDFKDETIATYGLKYVAEECGCKSGYLYAIKAIDGKFIGFIGIDYVTTQHAINDRQHLNMISHAASIGGVLMNHLKQ